MKKFYIIISLLTITILPITAFANELPTVFSKFKLRGRAAMETYFNEDNISFRIPDTKLHLLFLPDSRITFGLRLVLDNAIFNNLDFLNADVKILDNPTFSLTSRIGRFKMNISEETWENNPIETALVSTSVQNISGSDEGIEFFGNAGNNKNFGYSFTISNGTSPMIDSNFAKAFFGKLSYNILDNLYVSGTYFYSGDLEDASSAISIASLTSMPTGATSWSRQYWEITSRYDYKKGVNISPTAYSDSKAILRISYGQYYEDVTGATGRDGQFGYGFLVYNFNKFLYGATRYSIISLDNNTQASLAGITTNQYQRLSTGVGYRLSDNSIIKLEYTRNFVTDSTSADPAEESQVRLALTARF